MKTGTYLKPYLKKLGLNIRAARVRCGLRQEDVEAKGIVSWRHYQKIESGQINVRVGTLLDLANLFDTTVDELTRVKQ